MRVSYNDLIDGKAIKIDNKRYLDTRSYVEPFLEIMSEFTNDFRYTVRKSDTMVADSVIYPRVLVEAISPYPCYKDLKRVDCLVYGLDTVTPMWKVYTGFINTSSGIFLTVNDNMIMDNIQPDNGFDYESIKEFVHEEIYTSKLELFDNVEIPYDNNYIAQMVGNWIIRVTRAFVTNKSGKVMLPSECVPKAYKLLYEDAGSPYYIAEGTTSSLLNIYKAWASTIADNHRDLLNRFEKTTLLEKILN